MKLDTDLFAASVEASRGQQNKIPVASLASTKYHRAALDGYIDMLCDASKRDTNLANDDHDGLTPTLMAAQSGQLDALRILVGRGGDPERTNSGGSSALHLAAARGHLNCVSFLVNFGVNMWSLDNDLHTAKDAAAIEQRKEVLDYLDQMMAKQSALNTRNVQKLKEKAKVGAEKRLKQVRKAQLKAIKQVEKDERYLVKLSHNRRLLKAAHSISDIKLVGRPLETTRGPNHYLGAGNGSSSSSSSRLMTSGGSAGSSSRSPSLANLMQHKLQMDLLGRPMVAQNRLHRRSCASSSTDESSAYSTSSVSSYLSATGSDNAAKRPVRPKYSDLVAVNEAEKAKLQATGKKVATSGGNEHASVKSSSSSLGNKFWGIGGVSRKVQLRRLLRAGATQSSSDLSGARPEPNNPQQETSVGAADSIQARSSLGKLCQVQPTIKLKLNLKEPARLASAAAGNKWPGQTKPGLMTRTVSEPNFAQLRADEGEDDCDMDDNLSASTETKLSNPVISEPKRDEASDKVAPSQLQCQSEPMKQVQITNGAEESQQQLLNQCLSQLKLRHSEALTMQNQQPSGPTTDQQQQQQQLLRPSRLSACVMKGWPEAVGSRLSAFGHSDELIQHQLSAGQFPLRPSLIKQKQLQSRAEPMVVKQPEGDTNGTRSTASVSVDSIGSAGSFAKRNSRPSSTSGTSSSSTSYRSSSIDTAAPGTNHRTEVNESLVQDQPEVASIATENAPPLPPPLPPKTLSQATIQSALRDAQLRRREAEEKETVSPKTTTTTIETFLRANGLADLTQVFAMEEIDLEALLLLSEEDLKSLNVLLGPRRKLLKAIDRERRRLEARMEVVAGPPMYVVVDTQL